MRSITTRKFLFTLLAIVCYTNAFSPSGVTLSKDVKTDDSVTKELPEVEDSSSPVETNLRDLPPVLQSIADERREFQVNLGKAMDTLRKDMPEILRQAPDYSIYHDNIRVIDPSGVQLTGIESYKQSVQFLQAVVKFWFQERSGLQFRMVYDFARSSIRVSWHVVLVPKVPLGKPIHVDGISMYKLDSTSGKIIEHQIDNLMINDTPVIPPYGIFSLVSQDLLGLKPGSKVGVPAGI